MSEMDILSSCSVELESDVVVCSDHVLSATHRELVLFPSLPLEGIAQLIVRLQEAVYFVHTHRSKQSSTHMLRVPTVGLCHTACGHIDQVDVLPSQVSAVWKWSISTSFVARSANHRHDLQLSGVKHQSFFRTSGRGSQ